ncbi:16S rRNA (uracil(1498)-N(3))-methyltransferase [Lacticaseibacillus mingshuiensis]|uniref:Ribosomal RNA small subunit methyltransferase E n=1 Tax=Lacticaseibacillus mingshuiensis TaxID=2799574 RepID=A0ABW4CEB6_9LACO|nr:16S rRNA (uracil(1498)-N(3))-methyltransferase [Lacticaseibacillus mingshuiensis]
MRRFFVTQALPVDATLTLPSDVADHAIKVLRMQVGDALELADGQGAVVRATIVDVTPLTVHIDESVPGQVELPLSVHLFCGLPKGDKAEWIVQKATELGASTVTFFPSTRATAKWPAAKVDRKLARLVAIAQGAAEQSHRAVVPAVGYVAGLASVAAATEEAKLVAYEESAKLGERAVLATTLAAHPKSLAVVFGPEGGLTPAEVATLGEAGFLAAGLGPRILRTETAPLYLLSAVSALTELQGASDE